MKKPAALKNPSKKQLNNMLQAAPSPPQANSVSGNPAEGFFVQFKTSFFSFKNQFGLKKPALVFSF